MKLPDKFRGLTKRFPRISPQRRKPVIAIAVLLIIIACTFIVVERRNTTTGQVESAVTPTLSVNSLLGNKSNWIKYNGAQASRFTFLYPTQLAIKENTNSVLIYEKDNTSSVSSLIISIANAPVSITDCEQTSKVAMSHIKDAQLTYARQTTIAGLSACEYRMTISSGNKQIFQITDAVSKNNKTYYLKTTSASEEGLVLYLEIAGTFNLN